MVGRRHFLLEGLRRCGEKPWLTHLLSSPAGQSKSPHTPRPGLGLPEHWGLSGTLWELVMDQPCHTRTRSLHCGQSPAAISTQIQVTRCEIIPHRS